MYRDYFMTSLLSSCRSSASTRVSLFLALLFVACSSSVLALSGSDLQFHLPAVATPGLQVAERDFVIRKVSSDNYLMHSILVKTKSSQRPDKGATSFQSIAWTQTLSPLGVSQIRAPFQSNVVRSAAQDPFGLDRIFEVNYSVDVDAFDACAEIAKNPDVEYATPIFIRRISVVPSDPRFSNQYAMTKIQASQAWDISTGDQTMVIADVDSGVDFEHEDLAGNLWTNPGETGLDSKGKDKRTNGVDDDGNGYVDDFRGWDFVGNISTIEASQGTFRPDNDPKVRSATIDAERDHGTGTTGCAAAVTNNSKGIASIGYKCKYLPIKCGSDQFGNVVLRGYEGVRYATDLGAKIINCSWGGQGSSPAEQDLMNYAVSKGALVIAAAGNDSKSIDDGSQFPACYDNVLVVGATDASDHRASFSNTGMRVDVWAPGDNILTTQSNNKYGAESGTSFSCPITSGLAALIRCVHPDWTPRMVYHQLRSTCDNVIVTNQSSRPQFYGRINAYRALNENRDLNTGTTPGLEVSSMNFDGKSEITATGNVPAVFNIRNYLGKASNVVITIAPKSNAVTFSQTTFNLASIPAADSVALNCTVAVQSPTYFTKGSVDALVTMTAGSYTNYQNISISYNIATPNTYTTYASTPTSNYTGAYAKGAVTFWAVGRRTSGKNIIMHGTTVDSTQNDGMTCVWGNSSQTAVVGTATSHLLRTANAGSTWTQISTSSFCSSTYSINFFDSNTGIVVGAPVSGAWYTGVSNDGGSSWTKGVALPAPLSGETSQNSAIVWNGDNGWIGTSKARVLYTSDRGASWNVASLPTGGVITQLAFANNKLGYAITRPTGTVSEQASVLVSIDGGRNWSVTGYSFPASGPHPVYAYAPTNSTQFVAVCSLSEVMMSLDSGKSCAPLLTENGQTATAGFGLTTSSNVTLYILGKTIGVLKFPFVNSAGAPAIDIPSSVQFDTLELQASQSKTVGVKNTGNALLTVSTASINPDAGTTNGEFLLTGSIAQLNANESGTYFVKFSPSAVGKRSATLSITSNAGTRTVSLVGYGKQTPNDVEDQFAQQLELQMSPQPADEVLQLTMVSQLSAVCEVRIYSLDGSLVKSISNTDLGVGTNKLSINVENLPSGSYVCQVRTQGRIVNHPLVIIH